MEILFEQPDWLIGLCVLLSALFALVLYRRDRLNRHMGVGLRAFLGVLRFGAFFFLALFLLHPLIRTIEQEIEQPIIVVAQDNTESMVLGADSAYLRNEWPGQLTQLTEALSEQYEVMTYTFGDGLTEGLDSLSYQAKTTDFSALFDGLYSRYSNRNLGGVVIASDGIFNVGKDPRYASRKLNAPIFTIALGDTAQKRDLRIADVANNRLAYLGNRFPIEIAVEGRKTDGMQSVVSIQRDGKTLWSEPVTFNGAYDLKNLRAVLDADKPGLQRYTVIVSPVNGEETTANNRRDVFIEVLESRQQVLILAASPHPDVRAMRESISSNLNYEVTTELVSDFDGDIESYSLIIFHQLPSANGQGLSAVREAIDAGKGTLLVLGAQTDFNAFNDLRLGYAVRGYRGTANDVFGSYAKGFPYFKVNEDQERMFRELPPLAVPAADFEAAPGSVSLITQRVGMIETELPLLSFNQVRGGKVGLLAGEGIWRWRMVSFLQEGNHRRFDDLISSTVQYLASREDRRQFRVDAPRDVLENERIVFSAEVYNDSYEAITDPEVDLVLTDSEGAQFTYTFGRAGNFYRLDAGFLPVGDYTWKARTSVAGRSFEQTGALTVKAVQLEMANTVADHQLLYSLAADNGGEMLYPSEVSNLAERIAASGEAVAVSYERSSLTDLINLPWILFIILVLLSVEWLLRKRSGSY